MGKRRRCHRIKKIEAYAKDLDSTLVYMPRQHHKKIFSVDVQTSTNDKKVAPSQDRVEASTLPHKA